MAYTLHSIVAIASTALFAAMALGQASAEDPERAFQNQLEAAKKDPSKADFGKLRIAFTKTSAFDPYPTAEPDLDAIQKEVNNGERAAALQAIDRFLEGRWVDIEAQAFAAAMCKKLGVTDRESLHRGFMNGLLNSILDTGDGTTPEKAFVVITIPEEYVILRVMGMKPSQQALMEIGGHDYDVHTCTHPDLEEKAKVHFNIDIPKKWLRKQLGDALEKQKKPPADAK